MEAVQVDMTTPALDHDGFRGLLSDMTSSISSTRETIKKLSTQMKTDTKEGISLLSLKHHLMLSYCQALVFLSAYRVLGHTPSPSSSSRDALKPFGTSDRGTRGPEPSDLVNALVEKRIVLEKVKALESKMRYQVDKLVRRAAEPEEDASKNVVDDPLAFRPNPQNLMNHRDEEGSEAGSQSESDASADGKRRTSVYRPPKLVPMPYTEATSKSKKDPRRNAFTPSALSQLHSGTDPHAETSTGLGGVPALQSARARELARMMEYEEENLTRLVMTKKEAKRRRRDEEDVALGGTGANLAAGARGRGRRGVGLEDEFADVLRGTGAMGGGQKRRADGYEELRERGRKRDPLERAKSRMRDGEVGDESGPKAKRGRFEKDQMAMKRIAKRKANTRR